MKIMIHDIRIRFRRREKKERPRGGTGEILWVAEAERRIADLRAGKAREIPAEEVFRSIRSAIS